MKFFIFSGLFFLTVSASALSEKCIELGSLAIIDFMANEEPNSDLHLTKNKKGEVDGIVDAAEMYGTYDLTSVDDNGDGTETIVFSNDDTLVFVSVEEIIKKGVITCKVGAVDAGQNDQD